MFRKLFISTHCFFSLGKTRQRNASPDSKHPMWTFVSFRLLFTFGDKFQFTFNILDLRQVDNRSWKFLHSRNWLLFLWGGRSSLLSFRSTLFPSGRLPSSRTKGSHWNIDIRLDGSDVGNWLLRHIHKVLALPSWPSAKSQRGGTSETPLFGTRGWLLRLETELVVCARCYQGSYSVLQGQPFSMMTARPWNTLSAVRIYLLPATFEDIWRLFEEPSSLIFICVPPNHPQQA